MAPIEVAENSEGACRRSAAVINRDLAADGTRLFLTRGRADRLRDWRL